MPRDVVYSVLQRWRKTNVYGSLKAIWTRHGRKANAEITDFWLNEMNHHANAEVMRAVNRVRKALEDENGELKESIEVEPLTKLLNQMRSSAYLALKVDVRDMKFNPCVLLQADGSKVFEHTYDVHTGLCKYCPAQLHDNA